MFAIKNLDTGIVEIWSVEKILEEVNRDRSNDWGDYDESDWQEGWNEWVEGEFYSLLSTEEVKFNN